MSNKKEPPTRPTERVILHVDMDAFFAAVEVRDDPSLEGKPVIVGGTPEGRGVVSTASYEARRFGVHSAMPAATAVRLCPHGIFLRPRMERYVEASRRVFALLREYTPLVEPLSIDEAFLDLTGCHALRGRPADGDEAGAIAREVQARVREETGGLTCSAGLAPNKFLAKLASDLRKPGGLVVVPRDPGAIAAFLAPLPVRRLWGVGPRSAERLARLGLTTIGSLQVLAERDLAAIVGKESAAHLWRLARGLDDREVSSRRVAKSVSEERTFGEFIPSSDAERIESELLRLSDSVAWRLRRSGLWGRTVQIKVRDERFVTVTRSRSLARPTHVTDEIFAAALELFRERVRLQGRAVRLLGVGVSGLVEEPPAQLDFFASAGTDRAESLANVTDRIREKLGSDAITRGRLLRRRDEDRPSGRDGR